MKPDTLLTTLGRNPKRDHGSVNPPVHRTSTLIFDSFATMRDYESGQNTHYGYGRHGNETTRRLEDAIAQLEGADRAFVTSSGLAATVLAIMSFVQAGDHALFPDSIYASTRKFVLRELKRCGIEHTLYDPAMGAGIAALMKPNTKMVYVESPGSLTFEMQDVPAIAKVAHAAGAVVVSDSTWATPLFQRPFDLGIDVSIQSATKYIAGHSDLVMGTVSCKGEHVRAVEKYFLNTGMCASADNIYLAMRGLRSMGVRIRHQEQSALKVASWLEARPEVVRVLYPALPSSPDYALWKRDLSGAASLFAFEMKNATEAKVAAFIDALHHFGLGYSWGGYESLVIAYQPANVRSASHWAQDCWLVRLHVGLEDVDDLIADLDGGFKASAAVC